MSRDIATAAAGAIIGEVVTRTVAVALEFDSATLRLCGAPFPLTIGGAEFLGVGALGSISPTEETADLQATTLTLTLSGIPRDIVATALDEPYQNRGATVWEVPLDPATMTALADPIIVFRGRIDTMTIGLDGQTGEVSITITNRMADWERPRQLLFSDEEQRRRFAGDRGFEYAASTETQEIVWPAAGWFRAAG